MRKHKSLIERIDEYREYMRLKEFYAAFSVLAEMYHYTLSLDTAEQAKWMDIIEREPLPAKAARSIDSGILRDVDRIRHILSVGDNWNDDEILLILTLRVNIDTVASFLGAFHGYQIAVALDDIDEQIDELRRSRNRSNFNLALSLIKKNSPPLATTKWIVDVFEK